METNEKKLKEIMQDLFDFWAVEQEDEGGWLEVQVDKEIVEVTMKYSDDAFGHDRAYYHLDKNGEFSRQISGTPEVRLEV